MKFKAPKPLSSRKPFEYDAIVKRDGDTTGLSPLASRVFAAFRRRANDGSGVDMQALESELGISPRESCEAMLELDSRGLVRMTSESFQNIKAALRR